MIGLVIVSHSAKIAEGVCELAGQVARGKVRLAPAGGTSDSNQPMGTDVQRVRDAIDSVYSEDGVLVLMDLGSAVLSAEMALEFLDEQKRRRIRLCAAPLVEGAVAAASLAGAGAGLDEIVREAGGALGAKAAQLGAGTVEEASPGGAPDVEEALVTLRNPLGLHLRPAAGLVRMARRFEARVTLRNTSAGRGPAEGSSINGLLGLAAQRGHSLAIRAEGAGAREAVAALAQYIESGCGEKESGEPVAVAASPEAPTFGGEGLLRGIAASAGIGIGPLVKLRAPEWKAVAREVRDVVSEQKRLDRAIQGARDETRTLYEWAKAHAGASRAGIFDAQLLFLEDPELAGAAARRIGEERVNAEAAWEAASEAVAEGLGSMDDPYLRARAADVKDVAARVMRRLTGVGASIPALGEPSVLAAHDLNPSEVKELDRNLVLGLCLETGSASAHSVILARAMGIPAVVGLGPSLSEVTEGTIVAVDGESGSVQVSPGEDQIREFGERRRAWLESRQRAEKLRKTPASTRDGHRVRVFANISGIDEAAEAVEHGAEGVGVLRTEFLFVGREQPPGEEEQTAAYQSIAESLGGRPLVIRTLDIGGDKRVPYVEIGEEANPFLGWRGIRVTLNRRDLMRTQLRAMLRAGSGRPVEILLPMVCSLDELRRAKAMIGEAEAELEHEGLRFERNTRVGVMIEAPAAVAIAGQLAREAAFFSIGSNDLIQYVMVADRTNARVASMADPFQPAVLRTIRQTIEAGRKAGIGVALCGELAADPLATPLLVGLGFDELSVSAPLIPTLKQAIARWTLGEAEEIARRALLLETRESVRELLAKAGNAR